MPFPGPRPTPKPLTAMGKSIPTTTRHKAGQGKGLRLRTPPPNGAQVAQSVEQWIENPRVGSSILSLGTITEYANVRRCSGEFKFLNKINCYYAHCVQACSLDARSSRRF